MDRRLMIAALMISGVAASARAATVFMDSFEGNTPAALTGQTFSTGATTGFNYWAAGTPGDMDAGFFSVVNRAHDVHSQFVSTLDADGNAAGHYAIYNGFQNVEGMAYSINLPGLTAGAIYTLSAAFLPLAGDPPYPQISDIELRHNGLTLLPGYTVTPVPYGTESWVTISRSFVASAGLNTLSISNLAGASNAGNDFGIDNVTVTSAAVPLPASVWSGLAGLVGLAAFKARKRR